MSDRESPVGVIASWVTLTASFVLSFATWVALGDLAGYGRPWALALPFCVDGYIVTALVTWMSPVSELVAKFARANTYGAAGVGVITQAAYHCSWVLANTHSGWQAALAAVVGALPPGCAALSIHLRGLVWRASMARAVRHPEITPQPLTPLTPPIPPATLVGQPPATATAKPASAGTRQSAPATASLIERVRPLVADGLGRSAIAKQLGITTHQARQAIDSVRADLEAAA